jgi:hypothetical protein
VDHLSAVLAASHYERHLNPGENTEVQPTTMNAKNALPKSAVGKIENPIHTVVPDGISRLRVGDVLRTTGTIGLIADPNWEVDSVTGPIDVHEVDPEGQRGRFYDITAVGIGEARVTFIDKKRDQTCEHKFSIT